MGGRGASSASASSSSEFNQRNFFSGTAADFTSVERPNREPDYISDSGSEYWYSADGVVRGSNHWGTGIASTDWFLDGVDASSYDRTAKGNGVKGYGKAKWTDFVQNADYTYYHLSETLPKGAGKPIVVEKIEHGLEKGKLLAQYKVSPSQIANGFATIGDAKVAFSKLGYEDRIYDRDGLLKKKRRR